MSGDPVKNILSFLLLLFAGCSAALACDVPVYRYALERWPSATYEVVAFYRGALTIEQSRVVELLGRPEDGGPHANCTVRPVELGSLPDGPLRALRESLDNPSPPLLALLSPHGAGQQEIIWSGSLTAGSAEKITGSRARREIARRILSGEAAVWVLLESGDREKDEAAAALLEGRLELLERSLRLPEAVDRASRSGAPELRVDFSMLRLSRSDPEEEVLVRLLMHTEQDLGLYASVPMAFPVYGRGRVLYALVGEGISQENIDEACAFLVGPCACEIKALNPGLDLLMRVDWDAGLAGSWVNEVGLPPLAGLSALSVAEVREEAAAAAGKTNSRRISRNILLVLGLIVLAVALLSVMVVKSGSGDKR
ncbi:MAG: hypothetical protein JXQ83_10280 [Candidatus Glassbacteria bacterium]|nr:hypothetical protein [Candidatus Glassbacteria bacterium]